MNALRQLATRGNWKRKWRESTKYYLYYQKSRIMNLDELNQEIKKIMHERNNNGIPEFEGYSPAEMHNIIHFLFDSNCPIRIKKLKTEEFIGVPIFNGVKFLLEQVVFNNGLKLTAKGFLPTKIVADLYNQKYFTEEMIEKGISKLYKETDSLYVRLCRILLEITGAVKKSKGKMTITVKGKKFLGDEQLFIEEILKAYCTRFNWAYFDGYESENIARLGCGFSIILLGKYGKELRDERFFANKYFEAFPMLKENVVPNYGTLEDYVFNCYSYRMIEQFGLLTGLISIENSNRKYSELKKIQTTNLFEKLIDILPPF